MTDYKDLSPKSKRLFNYIARTMSFPEPMVYKIQELADVNKRSFSSQTVFMLEEYFAQNNLSTPKCKLCGNTEGATTFKNEDNTVIVTLCDKCKKSFQQLTNNEDFIKAFKK